jgi:hypothetical protein
MQDMIHLRVHQMDNDSMQRTAGKAHFIPLPFATGAIGLLLGVAMPGGISGGQGFLIGFLIGVVIMIVEAFARSSGHRALEEKEPLGSVPQEKNSGYGRQG